MAESLLELCMLCLKKNKQFFQREIFAIHTSTHSVQLCGEVFVYDYAQPPIEPVLNAAGCHSVLKMSSSCTKLHY